MQQNIYVSNTSQTPNQLTGNIRLFLKNFSHSLEIEKGLSGDTISVGQTLGSVAFIYEKIRNSVEYKGENVVRRNAIERILKRLIWDKPQTSNVDFAKVSNTLLKELVQARYLPNRSIPIERIGDVSLILGKYSRFLSNRELSKKNKKLVNDWLFGVASSEIEDLLDPSNRDLFVDLMHQWFMSNFNWLDDDMTQEEKNLQVYLAVHRAYTKSDDAIMRYHLLNKIFRNWIKSEKDDILQLEKNFDQIHDLIENSLNHPKRYLLYRKVKKSVAPFEILHDVALKEELALINTLNKPGLFEKKIRKTCLVKYNHIKKKTRRSITRSVIYIFITKILIAIAIEIPVEIYFEGSADVFPLLSNILFPPFLMAVVGSTIKAPGEKNTNEIVRRIKNVVYTKSENKKTDFTLTSLGKKSKLKSIFTIVYAITFLTVFMFLAFLLSFAGFSIIATLIFFAFLSLVLLFVMKIKLNANEIKIFSDEGTLSSILEVLSLPFLNLGLYLSQGFSKINIFSVLLDFLIEAPLKSIVEVLEEWFAFIRNKKDEVVNLPD